MVFILSGAFSCYYSLTCVEPWILNLLVKFVSSCLESIKLQMPLMEMKAHQTIDAPDGDENDLQLWFP
jgi:hypothetical protein